MRYALFFICTAACTPLFAHASVVINEVAWMGTAVSANDEWIELYNDGAETVVLDGWVLKGEDGTPNIALSGTVNGGDYFLLERTDDETVPSIPADVIYSGALGNETENLSLVDAGGAIIDSIQSGENWSLGGDNTTKHTAQRQADGSWITGVPSPRAANSTENTKTAETPGGEVAGTSTSKKTSAKTTGGYTQKVHAYAGQDFETVAGAYAFFEGYGVDEKSERLGFVRYTWTFGDGATGRGESMRHIYHFPGTYTAVLSVSGENQKSRDKVMVSVTEPLVAIPHVVYGARGYIAVRNESARELDLSGWRLRLKSETKDSATFTFPYATLIAPHTTIPFPSAVTDIKPEDSDRISLILPNGKTIAKYVGSAYVAPDIEKEK